MTQEPFTQDQLEWISEASARGIRHALRRYVRGALVGFLILAIGTGYAVSLGPTVDDLNGRDTNICQRLNIVRAQSNVSDSVSFGILSSSTIRERALAKSDRLNRAVHARSADELSSQAARLTVTDLTNCNAARDPKYRFPLAGPIGNPETGAPNPGVQDILKRSEKLVQESRSNVDS